MLVIDAIERIEVAVRSQICTNLAINHKDSHWHLNKKLFKPEFNYTNFLEKCMTEQKNSKEKFVLHYKNTYSHPEALPSWIVAELLPMGTWSIIFHNLINRSDKKSISDVFKLSPVDFASCLHTITYIRNLCAHHSRLWNRHFTIRPPQINLFKQYLSPNTTFAAQAVLLHIFLKIISPANTWSSCLYELINSNPFIKPEAMGFSQSWQNDDFWK